MGNINNQLKIILNIDRTLRMVLYYMPTIRNQTIGNDSTNLLLKGREIRLAQNLTEVQHNFRNCGRNNSLPQLCHYIMGS